MSESITVLIVDDHPVVRSGLKTFLDTVDGIVVVGEASDGAEAIAKARDLQPDIVLMDLAMPNMDGIEATKRIDAKVIALTSFATDDKIFPAIRAGAVGYLLKESGPDDLADAIKKVHAGESILSPQVQERVMQEVAAGTPTAHRTDLTVRERDVLRLIARGMSNRQIATELGVAEKTVKTHVSNVLLKLGLHDRTQAALYAVEHGLGPKS